MMLTGLVIPSSGSATVFGHDILKDSVQIRREVGLLPEGFGFYGHLTAKQNLDYIAELNDIPRAERAESVDQALKAVGLEEFQDRKAGAYSRGMTQRLGIAQALIKDPELLVLDEPTAGVDPTGARVFKDLVSTLNSERGKTIIMCTHLLHEVGPLCTHVAIMNRGRFGTTGRVDEIVKKMLEEEGYRIIVEATGDLDAFVKGLRSLTDITDLEVKDGEISVRAATDVRAQITKMAATIGVEILSIRRLEPSLEDIFMKEMSRRE